MIDPLAPSSETRSGRGKGRRSLAAVVAAGLLGAHPALAQSDRTGTGGGPLTTQTSPNTMANGVTRPPSRAASPTSVDDPDRRTAVERKMDRIDSSVCTGCDAK